MRLPVYERREGISPLSIPQAQANPAVSDNGLAVSKSLEGVFGRIQEIQNGMEDARTLELFNKFKMDSQEYHENPDRGIYNTRFGYQAYGIYKEADDWLRRKGEDYARELPSRRAQANFRKMAREHIEQRGLQNSRFEAAQMLKYQNEQADASIKNSLTYAEQNWQNQEAINKARQDIRQALELKTRGMGAEAFKNAYDDIEDQLGVARIRQAFVKDPLEALAMLDNPDIHLKPDTRAKLTESLTKSTEVYELQAIASEYAKYYTPTNAVEANRVLNERYGADKGQKAFAALARLWNIDDSQKAARDRAEREAMQNRQDEYMRRFNDPSRPQPTKEELLNDQRNRRIDPQFVASALRLIDAKENAERSAADKENKTQIEIELWRKENNNDFLTDEELEQLVTARTITSTRAEKHKNTRDEYNRQKEQEKIKKQQQNKSALLDALMDGTLTEAKINEARNNDDISPEDAFTLSNHLRTENERRERNEDRTTKQAQQDYRAILEKYVQKGYMLSSSTADYLYEHNFIDRDTRNWLYSVENNAKAEYERARVAGEKRRAKEAEEKAKLEAKALEEQRKNELDREAKNLADREWRYEGEASQYIHSRDDLSLAERDYLFQRFQIHYNDKKQIAQDEKNANKNLKELLQEGRRYNVARNVFNMEDVKRYRERYEAMYDDGEIDFKEYNELIRMLDDRENMYKRVAEDIQRRENFDIAKSLVARYGLKGEHDARREITETYSDPKQHDGIMKHFNDLIQDLRSEQNDIERAKAKEQEKLYSDIVEGIRKNLTPYSLEELDKLDLKNEQKDKIRQLNAALYRREELRKMLENQNYNGFRDMDLPQQQAMISRMMGVSEEQRKANFSALLARAEQGTLSNAEIDFAEIHGHIWETDAEALRTFDSKFDKMQKARISAVKSQLISSIRRLMYDRKELSSALADATVSFALATTGLDTKASNFENILEDTYKGILDGIVERYSANKTLEEGVIWEKLTRWGEIKRDAQKNIDNYVPPPANFTIPFLNASGDVMSIAPGGEISSFDNIAPAPILPQREPQPDVPGFWSRIFPPQPQNDNPQPQQAATQSSPQPVQAPQVNIPVPRSTTPNLHVNPAVNFPRQNTTPPAPQRRINWLDMIDNSVKTSGFTDARNYRVGTHNGIDIAGTAGSPIKMMQTNIPLTVTKVNTKSPYKGGGNSVTLGGRGSDGKYYEFIFSHMQNGSINLNKGDTVNPGDIIGLVGNTGMTSDKEKGGITAWYEGKKSGYHLDLKIKVDGKYVDPEKFIPPQPFPNVGPTIENARNLPPQPVPQPVVPPVISSDKEQYDLLYEVFGWRDISGDIAASNDFGLWR